MKDIKKMLKEQAQSVFPDGRVKEDIKRELGIAEEKRALALAHGGEKAAGGRRKPIVILAAGLLAAALLCAVLLPVFLRKKPSPPGPSGVGNLFAEITDADSFYAYGAASVGALLTSAAEPQAQAAPRALSLSFPAAETASAAEDVRVGTVNRYMALVEGLLSRDSIDTSAVASEYGYEYGMRIGFGSLYGGDALYTLYYDKIFRGGETDGDEREENYAIAGLLVADGVQYPVEGNYETESEREGSESELYFKAYTDEARTSYIEVEQEYESEKEDGETETEQEYVYSVYEKGELVERTTAEYEAEEGELELVLTIEKDGVRERLKFESGTRNGESILLASGTIGGKSIRFTVYIREGTYHYVFEDGSYSDQGRHDRDDDDDDDDDDD